MTPGFAGAGGGAARVSRRAARPQGGPHSRGRGAGGRGVGQEEPRGHRRARQQRGHLPRHAAHGRSVSRQWRQQKEGWGEA